MLTYALGRGVESYDRCTVDAITKTVETHGDRFSALIDAIVAAQTRPALVTACRALDRGIRTGRYWIPHWYKASHWIAYWDVFGHPAAQPRYFRGIPETWWYDPGRAAKARPAG